MTSTNISLNPIGRVLSDGEFWNIHIDEAYRKGLDKMDQFSHFLVLWWASAHDNPDSRAMLHTPLPYAPGLEAGVFACRSEFRPNPIGVTVCQCLDLDMENGVIRVPYMDAFDGTPVLDLKPYFPVSERVREARVPQWVETWPQWYEEAYKLADMFAECGE
ncbi:TrmO family methyltransferase domain-containing protein [Salidesulfovibrio onnuriiensis]|uniref:TrmO family methyltransferase domain-containing protein n=1 Tax=Salidesulfovibrio onnuriiensis TaxID=2583823 RepID=UPI0011C91983|nr:TrmO family methyltransferase [Salidesulfovibrio onnuriiensis]